MSYRDRGRSGPPHQSGRGMGGPSRGGQGRGGQQQSRGGGGGGRGGQRGGRGGRPQSPVRLDVRPIAKEVAVKNVFMKEARGKIGTPVQLIVNHYPINFEDIKCFHYDIEISLQRNDGKGNIPIVGPQEKKMRKERQMENIKVIKEMANKWPQVFSLNKKAIPYVFDGNKNLYSAKHLQISGQQTKEVTVTLDGCPQQTFLVKIKFVKEVQMNAINAYLNGTLRPNLAVFRESLQVLDIVLRYCPQDIRIAVGRNLFTKKSDNQEEDQRNRIEIKNQNSVIAFGHHQSINLTQIGLTLNVDRVTTPFRSDGPLVDYIGRQLRVSDMRNAVLDENKVRRLNSALKGLKIFTVHIVINGVPQKRKHTIEKMVNIKPSEHRIQTESGDQSIETYFQQKYMKRLQYRNLPMIQIKGGSEGNRKYLPVEVCEVYPDQPMPRKAITTDIQRSIVESTNSQLPVKRFEKIHESMKAITNESKDLMDGFGIKIVEVPVKLSGRELPPPKIQGDMYKLHNPAELKSYFFYNLSDMVRRDLRNNFENFFNDENIGMIANAKNMGFKITPINTSGPRPPIQVGTAKEDELKSIEESLDAFERWIKRVKEKVEGIQIIFVCIPKVSEIYETIKLLCDVEYGIPNQCIIDENFIRRNGGYFRNFLRKTNGKLQGQNQVVTIDQRPAVFKSPTMVVGADVTHPGYHNPLANERVISSIAAVVGSYDVGFTKYVASVSAQPMNTEIIADFDVLFRNLLKEFFKRNKIYPKNIVLFRDGVSESQFDAVKAEEIPLIFKAYRDEGIEFEPKVTVFVVQKRHHTRMIPLDYSQKNMKPGTVVDHTITNPMNKEFHLCSHNGMLGTSRHAKYVVLKNDNNLSLDDLEKMAYHMCYAYVRCPTPISIPIPVKYADLAAFRTKQHVAARETKYKNAYREAQQNETEQDKRNREAENIRLMNGHIKVHENIVFLPYYC